MPQPMPAARTRVTVVVPTRDRVALLPEAVGSALGQDGVDVEVVVVDDASTDGTAEWLAALGDPRVRTVRLERPQERTVARNAGLAAASAPYVLFLDDDDVLAPAALAALAGALERHPEAPVAAGTYATFGTYGPHEVPRRQPIGRRPRRRRMWREILWGWYLLPGAGLWRVEDLRAMGGWDESRTFAEDLELGLRVHPRPMALVPRVVLRYRQHGRRPDPDVEADHEAQNDAVRAAFVDRLSPRERQAAARLLAARPTFQRALAAYGEGAYGAAAAGLARGLRAVPALAVSPVLGPTLLAMLAKSVGAQLVPRGLRARLRDRRRADRAARYR